MRAPHADGDHPVAGGVLSCPTPTKVGVGKTSTKMIIMTAMTLAMTMRHKIAS